LGELAKCKTSKLFFVVQPSQKIWTCPVFIAGFQRLLPDMSSSQPGHVQDLQISKSSGLLRALSTCPVNRILQRLSPSNQICTVNSSDSREVLWIYPAPGPDMSGQSFLSCLVLVHRTCPVSRTGFQIYFLDMFSSLPDIFRSLTPQRADSLWRL
jgi:hypothetical protein